MSILITGTALQAQQNRPTAAFLNLDFKTAKAELTEQANSMLRLELERIGTYEMLDIYDVNYLTSEKGINTEHCFGKICLVEVGQQLEVDKMVSGTIEIMGDQIVIVLRIIDVKNDRIEKSITSEFVNIPTQLRTMIRVSANNLFGLENDEQLVNRLKNRNQFDSEINNPYQVQLRSDGPRFGLSFLTGEAARIISSSREEGGNNSYPFMFTFGYQFEKMYLNEGPFQALFEFIPMISGVEQRLIIPSLSILAGFRNNNSGWELALGPTASVSRTSKGFYNSENEWIKVDNKNEIEIRNEYGPDFPSVLDERMDLRGTPTLTPGFLIAAGKTLKSGKLNIPINAFLIPSKQNVRFGISFGFNSIPREVY